VTWLKRLRVHIFVATVLVVAVAPASAQIGPTRVRVTRDQATIWRQGFASAAAIVKAGTVLEVVGIRGDWYEVILPTSSGIAGQTGLISVRQVELFDGPPPKVLAPVAGGSARAAAAVPSAAPQTAVRVFGQLGYQWFDASNSFNAVVDRGGGVFYGAGGEFRYDDRIFVLASLARFRSTGERVFVLDNEVFKLGIPDTITVTPLTFTAGYRFPRRSMTPYVGGGIGRYYFTEKSEFADPSEDVDAQFTSYHFLGGVEWRGSRLIATSLELQYTHVPDALTGGVATAFNEHNLGGVELRVKVLVGR
jgi:opacity protein-like surface antigen